jgi:hypothetical protein
MRLNFLPSTTLHAARVISLIIKEAKALPRWNFDYTGRRVYDPKPDILVLGAYVHPSTGNRLIGGINLNYLTSSENDQLEQLLPDLLKGRNLYERYNIGRLLNPLIFDTYYRTYNADHIDMIGKSKIYPRFGSFVKGAKDKKQFKPMPQQAPQEPPDVAAVDAQKPAPQIKDVAIPTGPGKEPPRPEPVAQDIEFDRHDQEVQDEIAQGDPIAPSAYEAPIEPVEPEEVPDFDAPTPQPQPKQRPVVQPQSQPQQEFPSAQEIEQQQPEVPEPIEAEPEPIDIEPEEEELDSLTTHDEDDLIEDGIRYYSPTKGRYIVESWTRSR